MNQDHLKSEFTHQVLGALQLDACHQAQTLLDDFADKSLPSLPEELTRQHLDNCANCRALYATIMMMNTNLPALQSLQVPAGFTASVINRTVHQAISPPRKQKPQRLRAWLRRPRFALESAYAMTVIIMLFSGLTGVNAFDTFHTFDTFEQLDTIDKTLWERARPRLVEPQLALQKLSTQLTEHVEQQSEKIETTYDDTTQAIHIWTQEKYTIFAENFAELMR